MNPSTAQATVMVDEFLRCGVTDAVLAPGSRSTPLALALAAAEARGEITLHVRLDERSAGYLAVGIAKVTGVPPIVVTTSGTAAVNLHPAIVEADQSSIPIIAVTADRPPQLRGVGANQTIRQAGVFGGDVRLAVDMATATEAPTGQVRYWRSTVARVVAASTDAVRPGPVHLNVPFAEPLVPDGDDDWPEDLDGRPDGRPWTADSRLVAGMSTPLDDVLDALLDDERGAGARHRRCSATTTTPRRSSSIDELADALGWPVIAEPSGNGAGCSTALSHGPLLLADAAFADAHVPEIVVTIGRVGLNRSVLRMIARAGLHVAVDTQPEWSDPTRTADVVVASVPLPPTEAEIDDAWLESWQRADVLAAAAVETALFLPDDGLTGMHVARITANAVPDGGLLFVGAVVVGAPRRVVRGQHRAGRRHPGQPRHVRHRRLRVDAPGARRPRCSATAAPGRSRSWATRRSCTTATACSRPRRRSGPTSSSSSRTTTAAGSSPRSSRAHPSTRRRSSGCSACRSASTSPPSPRPSASRSVVTGTASELTAAIDDAVGLGGVRIVVARTCAREREAEILVNVQRAVGEALGSA